VMESVQRARESLLFAPLEYILIAMGKISRS